VGLPLRCAAGLCIDRCGIASTESLKQSVAEGCRTPTIGLIGAEMASQPGIAAVCEFIRSGWWPRASPSRLSRRHHSDLARALGLHSITARSPSHPSRLGADRRIINKEPTEPEILRAAEWLVVAAFSHSSSTSMVGLPIGNLRRCRRHWWTLRKFTTSSVGLRQGGGVTLSVNAFSPKPGTPLQWEPMERDSLPTREARRMRNSSLASLGSP